MINPTYRFELSAGASTIQAHPIYKDDLAKEFEKESNEEFFRAKLSGKLTFVGDDFRFVESRPFDTQFGVAIYISYDVGQTWSMYWQGTFWKTDCEFDGDANTVVVQPSVSDQYNEVLAGLEKEYNLIELAPEIVPVKADKRPMVQVYVPGQSVIGCFLSGMWWEQDADPVTDEQRLKNDYHFALSKVMTIAEVSGSMSPQLPDIFTKQFAGEERFDPTAQRTTEFAGDAYKLVYTYAVTDVARFVWSIVRVSDNVTLWQYAVNGQAPSALPLNVILSPVSGSGATGTVTVDIHDMAVYSRLVCDTETIQIGGTTLTTYAIPDDDIVDNNRNYRRAIGYYFPETIIMSTVLVATPTPWGIYQPGQYYSNPADNPYLGVGEAFPVARNSWGRASVWYAFSAVDWIVEESARSPFTLRDAFPLSSVISVLLGKVAPGVTHAGTTDYSLFLYGTNPLNGIQQTLLITPKSNVISAGYDQPAQKAQITLKKVLEMLRDCFRCYWFIDAQNRFRIEHISYFLRGGTYTGTPIVGTDLTALTVPRNGKEWAFARNQYQYEKPSMAARYQFGWMDDVTQLFEGYPIDILSKFVNQESIENIDVALFTSDIDYILLNPGTISKDGFVLMAAVSGQGGYELPYLNIQIHSANHILQNAYVAFAFLQNYYAYDMPAYDYEINGERMYAVGIKKLKTQQLRFPAYTDPDLVQLIRTHLGDGAIAKLSVNLASRRANVTLSYDTEQ